MLIQLLSGFFLQNMVCEAVKARYMVSGLMRIITYI